MCQNCGKRFSLAQNLKEHKYSHTKERPYTCGIKDCKRSFKHPSELSLHRRSHPEYRLRKYHYLNVKRNTTIDKNVPRIFMVITMSHNPMHKEEKTGNEILKEGSSECVSNLSPKVGVSKSDLGLDMKFLEYLKNITEVQVGRPMLPVPS